MKPIDWGNACIETTKLNIEANKRIDAIASILKCTPEDALVLFVIHNMTKNIPPILEFEDDELTTYLSGFDLSVYNDHPGRVSFIKKISENIKTNKRYRSHNIYGDLVLIVFPKLAKKYGIVFTPPEIVDFINNSVKDILYSEFGVDIKDESVSILDPFSGTGLFIDSLIDMFGEDNFNAELKCNEINPVFYYLCNRNLSKYKNIPKRPIITLCDTFDS